MREPHLRGCAKPRRSLPGGVRHAVTRALLRVLPRERASCARAILPPGDGDQLYFWRADLGRGEERVTRANRSPSESRSRKCDEGNIYDLLERSVHVCLRERDNEWIRGAIASSSYWSLGDTTDAFRGSSDGRSLRDFRRRRCVDGLPEVTERETWTASPSSILQ